MNKRNDWENLLELANKDLARQKISISITCPEEEGFYRCDILQDGIVVETYAENFYEEELSDLITEAWHYVNSKIL